MTTLYDRIRCFWDAQPCGTTHVALPPGSLEYFLDFDKHYEKLYPYLLPFLDLNILKGKTVLEIGLGSGYTLGRIAQIADKALGLDISGGTLTLNTMRDRHFHLGFELIQASATAIPLQTESVDAVVSIGCLHHIPDIQTAVDEIHRILKPGGIFKGMVYNRNSFRYRIFIPLARRLLHPWKGKSRQVCVNEMYDGSANPYGMVYSKAEVANLLKDFSEKKITVQNFEGNDLVELLPIMGRACAKIPRNFWLATMGRICGLDLYFSARKNFPKE